MPRPLPGGLTAIPGVRVGHAHDPEALTGCTVVLCEKGAVAGVDQRGGAPGTRETDALRPMHLVERVHAVVLTGGSAFGLDAAAGVVRYLEERGVGFDTGVAKVPIVPAAVIFDLSIGRADVRPDAAMGYAACQAATDGPVAEGNVGAGMGATVGKILGPQWATKAGLGSAALALGGGVRVAALMVVNALGDVVDPHSGAILAGARNPRRGPLRFGEGVFADTLRVLDSLAGRAALRFASRGNTVIGVVATNARLSREQATLVAQMAHDGIARTVRPAHTLFDGDTLFCLSLGDKRADPTVVGAFAAEVVAQAVVRAVEQATGAGGLPAARDLLYGP